MNKRGDSMKRKSTAPVPDKPKPPRNPNGVKYGTKGKPSKAQVALIERYKKDSGKAVVNNTIEGVINEQIYEIKEVIENLINYRDSSIFKVLPKDLDDKMRAYGMFAMEYFGKTLTSIKDSEVFIIPTSFRLCNKCSCYKHTDEFYHSNSDSCDGYVCMCKDCANDLFVGYYNKFEDIREAFIIISSKLDMVVYETVLTRYCKKFETTEGKDNFNAGRMLGDYIGETSIMLKSLGIPTDRRNFYDTNLGGIPFKCIPYKNNNPTIYDDRFIENEKGEVIKYNTKKMNTLRLFWGDFEDKKLVLLDNKFQQFKDRYNIDDLVREDLVKQLILEELDIAECRKNGIKVSDRVVSYLKLLKDAELSPREKEKTEGQEYYSSLGSLIAHCEENGPIIAPNKSFVDIDGVKRLWESIAGAIMRTAGMQSEYIDKFEEHYSEYTVDMLGQNVGDNNEETV